MDTLRAAVVVLRVAEAGSFAGAARALGVTPAAIARLVGRFEATHGAIQAMEAEVRSRVESAGGVISGAEVVPIDGV